MIVISMLFFLSLTCFLLGYVKGKKDLRRDVKNGKKFIEPPMLYYYISPEESESELSIKKPRVVSKWGNIN